jgi:hypothetical protein
MANAIRRGNVREGLSIDVWPEGGRCGRAARKRESDPESERSYNKVHVISTIA